MFFIFAATILTVIVFVSSATAVIGVLYVISLHRGPIVFYFIFRNLVLDFLPSFVLRQICKAPLPAVLCCDCLSLVDLAILQQVDSYAFRTRVVLIIVILPDLMTVNVYCLSLMSIYKVEAVCFRIISFYRHFRYRVDDLLAILVFIETCEGVLPIVCSRDLLRVDDLTVLHEVNCDGIRALAILIIIIVPGLSSAYGCLLLRMFIRDYEAILSVSGNA